MIKKLSEYLSGKKEVKFAYLFGSHAKNDTGPLSDIDIAVYLDKKINKNERFDLRLEFMAQISLLLKRESIDLIILNDSDIPLAYEVIYHGRLFHSKNELQRIRYETKVMGFYFDRKYYYDRHAKLLIENIAKEGIL
ncbi:MAG: type VII toxin-antitoxin system MntA family adenylyltransferase antitoxin [Elusimicrobiota bacterium]